MDFTRDEVDVAIRFSQHEDEGVYSETIIDEWLTPMVAPALVDQIKTPNDLLTMPLLHQDDITFLQPPMDWEAWFNAAGLAAPANAGTHFSQGDHAVNAALSGGGVLLGRVSMTERHLNEGRLVMPFGLTIWSNASYKIVCAEGAENRPQVARLIAWIRDEVAAIDALTKDRTFAQPLKS
jgi:LysR family glycine cleavage system transcriptional activator